MSAGEASEGSRGASRRRERRREGHSPRVAEVRRKPRHQGTFGWLRKSAYSQRSPLIILALLVVGFGLTALILLLVTRTTPTLPAGFGTPAR